MSDMQGSWVWYELMTPDADGAKAFYDKVVGWNIQTTHGGGTDGNAPGETPYGFIANSDGSMTGGVLHLDEAMCEQGARPCWMGYIGVDNVDSALQAIEAAGGKTVMPPRDVAMAGRIAMVADPCGAPVYIMTPTPPPGMENAENENAENTAFSPTKNGSCAWNELCANGQKQALDFYTGLFGWGLGEAMDMGPMGSYQLLTKGGTQIGAIMEKPEQMPVSAWSYYFRVPDIEAAKAAVTANGGTVTLDLTEVPGGEWVLNGIDPQGAHFALIGAKA